MKLSIEIDLGLVRGDVLEAVERAAIEQALALCGGNVTTAAELLGIFRQSLQRKIRRHALGVASTQLSADRDEGV